MQVDNSNSIKIGFVGLTDCAPILVAQELGFDRQLGIRIEPVKLKSWTAVRDAVAFEQVSCAHMPGALALAMHLGLSGMQTPMRVPLLLGYGGNAITVSVPLYERALELTGRAYAGRRPESGALVRAVVEDRKVRGERKVKLGAVHAFSSHNYDLRAWLAHAGLDPVNDLELIIVPRSKMVEALAIGEIDGFCIGDPWCQQAVEYGLGVTIATKADLYPFSPEKVLAFRDGWVKGYPELASAIVEAVSKAMEWASKSANHQELANIITHPEYLSVAPAIIEQALACRPRLIPEQDTVQVDSYIGFDGDNRPSDAAAMWLLAQMRRWGQVEEGQEDKVKGVFSPLSIDVLPRRKILANDNPAKGAFDGVDFDTGDVETYCNNFPVSTKT